MSIQKSAAFCVVAIFLASWNCPAALFDWSGDPLPSVKINTVAFRGWIPETTSPLSGTLVLIPGRHGDGRGMAEDARWQQLANDLNFAIIACQFSDGEAFPYQNDENGVVSDAINKAAVQLGELSGKPELKNAPLAFWGTSAGSNVSTCYCARFPERVVAFASSKGTRAPSGATSAKCFEIPMLIALGATDNAEWVKSSKDAFEVGRTKAPWTLALHPTEGHSVGASLDVAIPFLASTIAQRLGKGGASSSGTPSIFKSELPKIGSSTTSSGTTTKVSLKKIDLRGGWLGDPKTYEVAAYAQFKGSKSTAIWLPDETTAIAWQTYLRK